MTCVLLIATAWAGDPPATEAAPVPPAVSAPEETAEAPVPPLTPLVVVDPTALEAQVWFVVAAPGAPGALIVPVTIPISGHYDEHGGWVDGAWTPPPTPATTEP